MKTLSALLLFISLTAHANTDIETEDEIFAFVGEWIEMTETPKTEDDDVTLVTEYVSTYRVLETLEGALASDIVNLYAYDHYGKPPFSKYRYVLLFMREEDGKYNTLRNWSVPVYKTRSGLWAYCGSPYLNSEDEKNADPLEEIDFHPQLEFTTVMYNEEYAKEEYPEPFYEHINGKAICRQGVYLDELYRVFKAEIINNEETD